MAASTPASEATADLNALLRLLAWFSPAFPIGAFSYSSGLERAVDAGVVADVSGLVEWVTVTLEHGSARNDALLLASTVRAVQDGCAADLERVVEVASAARGTAELQLESCAQGQAFLATVDAAWRTGHGSPRSTESRSMPLPVAVGLAVADHGLPLAAVLAAFLHGVVANQVSAAVRLVPLGQTDGQRALARLEPVTARVAREVLEDAGAAADAAAILDRLGGAALGVDLASMQHETQYTRLFRS